MAEELKTLEEGYESLAAALKAKQEWQRKILDVLPIAEGEQLDAVVDRIKLLLWLHAEAVWNHHLALLEIARTHKAWREIVEQWERGHNEDVLPYTTSLETEVDRLRREVEFEALGGDTFSDADALAEAVPQCAVHPEGQGGDAA